MIDPESDLDLIARSADAAERGRADALAAVEAELHRLDASAARLRDIARLALLPGGVADRARRLSTEIWSGINGATVLVERAREPARLTPPVSRPGPEAGRSGR